MFFGAANINTLSILKSFLSKKTLKNLRTFRLSFNYTSLPKRLQMYTLFYSSQVHQQTIFLNIHSRPHLQALTCENIFGFFEADPGLSRTTALSLGFHPDSTSLKTGKFLEHFLSLLAQQPCLIHLSPSFWPNSFIGNDYSGVKIKIEAIPKSLYIYIIYNGLDIPFLLWNYMNQKLPQIENRIIIILSRGRKWESGLGLCS